MYSDVAHIAEDNLVGVAVFAVMANAARSVVVGLLLVDVRRSSLADGLKTQFGSIRHPSLPMYLKMRLLFETVDRSLESLFLDRI